MISKKKFFLAAALGAIFLIGYCNELPVGVERKAGNIGAKIPVGFGKRRCSCHTWSLIFEGVAISTFLPEQSHK